MRLTHNPRILSYNDVSSFTYITAGPTADKPELLSSSALFRACYMEGLPADVAFAVQRVMSSVDVHTLLFPKASADGTSWIDIVLLGTLDKFESSIAALVSQGDSALADVATQMQYALSLYSCGLGRTRCGDTQFVWGSRTYVMGIVNVTPDSFSGDGILDPEAALRQAQGFVEQGADIIDVGGESTRPAFTYPGAKSVDTETELGRVLPVIQLIARELEVPISIDTYKASVARAALDAGASMVNDVWGLMADPEMARVVAEYGVPVVIMHNKPKPDYYNLMSEVIRQLRESVQIALDAGVKWDNIIVDPGIGFGKKKEHSLEILDRLDELRVLGRPILLGTSRKSVIGYVLDLPPDQRLEGTAATVALGIAKGVDIVRVHDVHEMVRVARMSDAIVRRGWQRSS